MLSTEDSIWSFFQKCIKDCKKFTVLTQFLTIFQGNFAFFQPWHFTLYLPPKQIPFTEYIM